MKFTQYFLYTRSRPDRRGITDDWLQLALDSPIHSEVQSDGRIRKWVYVAEKYLRVVVLEDGETIHNAFFDRNFKSGTNEY